MYASSLKADKLAKLSKNKILFTSIFIQEYLHMPNQLYSVGLPQNKKR